jgi:peptidoglycan/LPS O-acetylase OafA/YrhL
MPYFLAGLLLAETSSSVSQARAESRMFWDVACLGLALLLFYWIHLGWALPYAGALTIFGCYWTALRSRWVARFLRVGFVSAVGGMCYSVYLLHNYVIGFAGQYTEKIATGQPFALRLLIEACLLGPAVLLVSGVFYLLVERPCMRPDWPARLRVWWSSQAEKSAVDVPEGKQMERMDCFVEESVPKPG